MKEDYLWDKTGGDPEIEKLEQALQVFRYKENAPPVIPAKVLPFVKKETPRKFFPFMRAIAACLAFASISLGVWILLADTKNEIAGDNLRKPVLTAEITNPLEQVSENELPAEPEFDVKPTFTKTLFIEKKSNAKTLEIKKSDFKSAKRNKTSKTGKIDETVRLTEEEKYAFDQLMFALSITSSKLKLVKDKVEGIEESNAVLETDDKIIRRK